MEIGLLSGGQWVLDVEAMRAMIVGQFIWKRCFACENGKVWVDGDGGFIVSPEYVSEHETEENQYMFYQDTCEDCHGVGFVFVGDA